MTYFPTIGLNHFLSLVVVAMASYRLTRVVVDDTITQSFRVWLWRHAYIPAGYDSQSDREISVPRDGWRGWAWVKAYQLFTCPHCTGWWISLGSFWAWARGPEWARWALLAVAVSGIQSFVSSRRDA